LWPEKKDPVQREKEKTRGRMLLELKIEEHREER
jgi:hypothetical protein